jgi:tetratricopeptide (TPR) repeat protein/peroxiredoxin
MTRRDLGRRPFFTRRAFLKSMGWAPILLKPSPFLGLSRSPSFFPEEQRAFPFSDLRYTPHYPAQPPFADVLSKVAAGSDEYVTEKYAVEIEAILNRWGRDLANSSPDHRTLAEALDGSLRGASLAVHKQSRIRSSFGIEVTRRELDNTLLLGRERFIENIKAWLGSTSRVRTAEFEIYALEEINSSPLKVRSEIRYDLVTEKDSRSSEERVGSWRVEWIFDSPRSWKAYRWEAGVETLSSVSTPAFVDVTAQVLGEADSYRNQLLHGADYWRTVLDGAIGVDVYGNNGVAAGDFDGDGFDDLYICQPAGLPNRLYRNRGDGTFEDVTERAGVGVLDNTACALFADFENRGLQDLLVVCGTGPVLFRNKGNGTFEQKRDAFKFARPPQGSFTHAALADYDRDGRLDIFLCTYMYYLGLDQYHYPIPYYDARNGPPNCLLRNEGDWSFVETTDAAGMNADNDRYSFACAWGDSTSNGLPDLFVANDFGSSQLYRNNGNGTFSVASSQAHVEEVGAGMSCCWCDFDNDGHQDVYVPSMWEAAGQRVSEQAQFHAKAAGNIRELYQRHARGNALYRNLGNGTFQNVGNRAAVEMGRWSWCSDFFDFDHDGFADLYVANGYISGPERGDLASFFWRQVVAKSPEEAIPAPPYERGWNAINELIRSDSTWHGYARNVMFSNNQDGTFSEISGPTGLDFVEDSRAFALADIDHDGRLEIILKNRNAPQLRILHNAMQGIGHSISFRLKGQKSNRDAIGSSITLEIGELKQTKYLQAGSGFLAQHSKELFFGVGNDEHPIRATVRWPSGLTQVFEGLPADHRIEIHEAEDAFQGSAFRTIPSFRASPESETEALPSQVATWLIDPLAAPDFSLPDVTGALRSLKSYRGSPVLLNFWSSTAPQSLDQLNRFENSSAGKTVILAVNVDTGENNEGSRSLAIERRFSFAVLFATDTVAGVYNIVYRHLFDRRRNLPLPATFLLNEDGKIVRVYQGPTDLSQILEDAKAVPATSADRMLKALPFRGLLVQDSFLRNNFTYGVAFYQHGYLEEAVASFEQVVAAKPDDPDAYYNLGTLNLRKREYEAARRYLEQALKLRSDYPEAWNNLGMIAAQSGRANEAIADFRKSLELRPRYAVALLNLGNLYRSQKMFDNAEECLKQALQLEPDDPEVNYGLGMLYAQQGQVNSASAYLQRSIEIRPDYPEALNNLGVLFVRDQQYAKAEDRFKTAIRVAPNFDQSYLNLARLYVMNNNSEQARKTLLDLLQLQPDNAPAKQALEMLK